MTAKAAGIDYRAVFHELMNDALVQAGGDMDQAIRQVTECATYVMLAALGEDPDRAGLRNTPARVSRMWRELLAGRHQDPAKILSIHFAQDGYDEMILLN